MQDSLQGIRLSPQQKRLWLLQERDTGYCAQVSVLLEGPVDAARLHASVEQVAARHEIFRTTFRREPGVKVPFQVIEAHLVPTWRVVDWRERPPSVQEAELERLLDEQRRRVVDLERGPLLEVLFLRFAERRSALLICLPALCADAATLSHLVGEISQVYGGRLEGGTSADDSSEEPVQYAQFSEWQNELLADDDAEEGRQYWHRAGLGAASALILPYERPVSRTVGSAHVLLASVSVPSIDRETVAKLDEMARGHGASLSAVLLTCWQALLFRVTGQRDGVIAVLDAGRRYEELRETMGLLAKWIPVRGQVDPTMPFIDLLSCTQEAWGEARQWQEYFTWEESAGQATAPVDPTGFRYDHLPAAWRAGTLSVRSIHRHVRDHRWKLTLSCLHRDGDLTAQLDYDPERFRSDYVACLADQFETLMTSLGEAPTSAVGELTILSDVERHRLVRPDQDRAVQAPAGECLHHLFEACVEREPEAPAVRCRDRQMTYAELNGRANQLAHALIRRGVGPDVLVALCVERSVDMLVGLLGILKAGGAYVPLDPGNSPARLAYEIAHADASVMVTQEHLLPVMPARQRAVLCLDRDAAFLDREPKTNPGCVNSAQYLAYVIYTSGSTGVPKGVAVTHESVTNYTRSIGRRLSLEPRRHFATVSTISADLGNTVIFASVSSGGCLHIIGYETATDASLFADYVARHPIDVLKIVPSHLNALLASSDGKDMLPRQCLILGGEALSVDLVARLSRLSQCDIVNHYGPTETTIGALTSTWGQTERQHLAGASTVPIGRPIANAEAYVLDERSDPVAVGVPGELCVGGMGLARGYLRQPEQTAERFVPDPFSGRNGARLYRTGDLVRYLPDGAIEFLGRLDHQVKIRGYRVELGEIEARLLDQPAVREVIVSAREDGSGGKHLVAYVVSKQDGPLDVAALRQGVKERLPDYMVPSAFVLLAALPLTSNGKVDRKALPPPDAAGQRRSRYLAPRTPTETLLAEIWSDLLKVPDVGVDESFFDLGGHSLLAIQLMHRVQKAVGQRVSLTAIFQAPTVAKLAALVSRAPTTTASPLVVLRAGGSGAPLYCCDPTGRHVGAYHALAECLEGARPVYGLDLSHLFHQDWHAVSITSIAEHYADLIRGHQPEGPYALLGWSLGGVIALAVARALTQHRQPVAFLGILDTQARTSVYGEQEADVLDELAEFLTRDRREEFRSLPPSDRNALRSRLRGLSLEERIEYAAHWATERGFLPSDIPMAQLKLRYALLKDAAMVLHQCKGRPLDVPVHVWWTTTTVGRERRPPLAWWRYTTGVVETDVVQGDHLDIIENPTVHRSIAGILTGLDGATPARERRADQ